MAAEAPHRVSEAPRRVLYYTLDGDVTRANELLEARGARASIELVGQAHEPFRAPSPDELAGTEAVIGEFMPVIKQSVDDFAEAGVRLVASMSIGLNHLDIEGLSKRGILVSNCPGYCAKDVAAHAVALMLDLLRKVTFANRDVLAGGWDPKVGYPVHRPDALTLGLVFFGRIAREVAPVARALGMRVLVWAPTKGAAELEAAGCEKAETLDELLRASDVVSLHCPLIPETEHLIGARELALMKPTAILVNTARGGCVDEEALLAALDENLVSGGTRGICAVGLDTLEHEASARNERLIHHPRAIVTPHSAYDSIEAADALRRMSLDAVCELLLDGTTPANCVNAAARA